MTFQQIISLAAIWASGFLLGALWQRARNSAKLKHQISKLETSKDALEQALKQNTEKKGS